MQYVSVGDEVVVYHNGDIAESDPLQINTVYAITLKTPADRTIMKKLTQYSSMIKYSISLIECLFLCHLNS